MATLGSVIRQAIEVASRYRVNNKAPRDIREQRHFVISKTKSPPVEPCNKNKPPAFQAFSSERQRSLANLHWA